MKKNLRTKLLMAFFILVLVGTAGMTAGRGSDGNQGNEFALQPPPFVNVVQAKSLAAPSVIAEEAGIAAWAKASTAIDLSNAIEAFRTVEIEESKYILGSVPLDNYPESEDVHVYVHQDGWILAYYLADEPSGKIFDWQAYHNSGHQTLSTKLENAINVAANQAGVIMGDKSFYHFQHPNAEKLLLIAEFAYRSSDSFEVNLSSDLVYYERSWSAGDKCDVTSNWDGYLLNLNGNELINYTCSYDWEDYAGWLFITQLSSGVTNNIEVVEDSNYGYGGLSLLYGAP